MSVPYEQKEVNRLLRMKGKFTVESEGTAFLWLWCKIESVLLKLYRQVNGVGRGNILRKVIANHKLMDFFVWLNKKVLPYKYSHMYMLLRKE